MRTDEQSGGGLRERKKLQTWRAIRAAAFELFAREGFDAVGVGQIAAAADVSRSTFFNYFATKEAVVFDTGPEEAAQWRGILAGRPADEPLWEALQAVLLDYVSTFGDYLVVAHRLKMSSPALMASSRDASDRFWAELDAWAAARAPQAGPDADPLERELRLGTAQVVFNATCARWDQEAGVERWLALMRRGFTVSGAGFAASARTT